MIRAIIFDMDGVLLDSMDAHFAAWYSLLSPYTKLSREEFNSWSGRSTRDILDLVRKKLGLIEDEYTLENKKDKLYQENLDKVTLFPSVKEVLEKLRGLGLELGIATSESKGIAISLISRFKIDGYFSIIVGKEMVKTAKPNPELFLVTAKKLGIRKDESLVIEDSPAGIEAARAAGMKVVAITTTHPEESLSGANGIINQIEELPIYIKLIGVS